MHKEKNFVSAVVYINNDRNRVLSFLDMLAEVFKNNFENSEIIFVNDCSTDKSVELIREKAKKITNMTVSIVNLSYFHGLESAMCAGNSLSIGDFIFEFDSVNVDYDPATIMAVYKKALEGNDIVNAVPNRRQKLSSKLFYAAMNLFSDQTKLMQTERFRILSRRVFNRIDDMNKTVPYRKFLYNNAGLRATSLMYETVKTNTATVTTRRERKYRRKLAVDSLVLFTDVGYHFSVIMTLVMMVIAFLMAIYSIAVYLNATPVAGWTTTVLFLSVAFFGVFGVMAVMMKYLQLIMTTIFRRKQYTFESIEKLTK